MCQCHGIRNPKRSRKKSTAIRKITKTWALNACSGLEDKLTCCSHRSFTCFLENLSGLTCRLPRSSALRRSEISPQSSDASGRYRSKEYNLSLPVLMQVGASENEGKILTSAEGRAASGHNIHPERNQGGISFGRNSLLAPTQYQRQRRCEMPPTTL